MSGVADGGQISREQSYRWRGADSPTPSCCDGANIDRGRQLSRAVAAVSLGVRVSCGPTQNQGLFGRDLNL